MDTFEILEKFGVPISMCIAFGYFIWKRNQWIQNDLKKDIELLGDETSGLMEDSSGIKILGMKLQLQKVLSLYMIDKMEDMSPIEIEILYNDTFGKVS